MSWEELRLAAFRGSQFLLVVTPAEDHGAHLPSGTDPMIGAALVQHCLPLLSASLEQPPVVLLPVHLGVSTLRSLACLRVSKKTLLKSLLELGAELDEMGVAELVLLSSHGASEHLSVLEKAAERLTSTLAVNVLAPSRELLFSFVGGKYNEEICQVLGREFREEETQSQSGDLHAGFWETSIMLAYRPDLVSPNFRQHQAHQILNGSRPIIEAVQHHRGYFGDPSTASAEVGRAALKVVAEKLVQVLARFSQQSKETYPNRVKSIFEKEPLAWSVLKLGLASLSGFYLTSLLLGGDENTEIKKDPLDEGPHLLDLVQ